MENIKVTLGIEEDSFDELVDKVMDKIDVDEKVKGFVEDYDFSEHIESYIDYNIDFEDKVTDALNNININDYIDMSSLSSSLDHESEARDLLSNYSPLNNCSTGEAFTEAIEKAVRYLLLKDKDFVGNIVDALQKHEDRKKLDEMKTSLMEEVKPLMFDEFKAELERYASHLEVQKAQEILSQMTTHVIPEIPTNNNGY